MLSISRALSVVGLIAIAGGPLSMAPVYAADVQTAQIAPVSTTRVSGVATDSQGAPVAGATITLTGPHTYAATTDARGAYVLDVAPGVYALSATKAGYATATEADFVVAPGQQTASLNATLQQQTFSSLQVIGRTSTNARRSQFNAGPAAIQTVNAIKIEDQGQTQITNIVNELPGISNESPGSGGNNAAPGAIRFLSIRGAFGNETATLIDGHPLANGAYGDFVSSFLNAQVLGGMELVKGPGAAAPQVINGIGGTINLRTRDPLRTPGGELTQGFDLSNGGLFTNLLYSGTRNKFGWVIDYGAEGATSAVHDQPELVSIPSSALINGQTILTSGAGYPTVDKTPNQPYYAGGLYNVATLVGRTPFNANFNNHTALIKGRYQFSGTTSLTASYLDGEAYADQDGNHLTGNPATFSPKANYTGTAIAPGSTINYFQYGGNSQIPPNYELDHEPMFNLEFHSAIKDVTVLARAFTANISRLQLNPNGNTAATLNQSMQLFGTAVTCTSPGVCAPQNFNGGNYTVSLPPGSPKCSQPGTPIATGTNCTAASPNFVGYGSPTFYSNSEEDRLRGFSFELDKPLGKSSDLVSVAYDYSKNNSKTYSYAYGYPDITTISIPDGSYQTFGTLLVRGIFDVTPKLNATLSNYFTTYTQHTSQNYGQTFTTNTSSRYDPRLGLVFRPNANVSVRAAAGGSVSFPYLAIGDKANGAVPSTYTGTSTDPTQNYATQTVANPGVKPETAFGYDLGGDWRVGKDRQTVVSGDVYLTNLFNQFLTTNTLLYPYPGPYALCQSGYALVNGSCTKAGAAPLPPQNSQVFGNQTINLGNARYEGVELAVARDPQLGWGYTANVSLQRAYDYNVSRCIYYSSPTCAGTQNANLGVVPYVNLPGSGAYTVGFNYGAVQNHSIPYSEAYGELRYRGPKNSLVQIGEQYVGPNNSYNLPAFFIASGSIRVPLGDARTSMQLSAFNLFNVYPNDYITNGAGVPVPLANGQLGLTNANAVGPRTLRLIFTRKFGGM